MKRKQLLIAILVALSSLFVVLIGILINFATSNVPSIVKPYLPFAWPLVGIITLAAMVVAVALFRLQTPNEPSALKLEKQNRQRMLAKVHAFWIKGVLEQSLHGAALVALGLHEQPDAIENPWRLVLQQPNQSEQPLPPGTRITQVYDDAGGELLILGEPGSGKTTLLLELTRDLLDRAQKDEALPMPVVFNLSSWAVKRHSLSEWLIDELRTKYQVPRKLARSWVNDDQILPLLDGLDEVASEYSLACVDAINAYRQEHGIVPTVICSRRANYFAQERRLQLRYATVVQPLTAQQIDFYLSSAGGQLDAVRLALHQDNELQELTTTPLMLSILTLAYLGKSVEDLQAVGSLKKQRQIIFATYIQRMVERRGHERYTATQTISWLTWLARQLKQHNQTEFYLESLQFDWFQNTRSRIFYRVTVGLVVWLVCGLVYGLIRGLVMLFLGMIDNHNIVDLLNIGLSVGLVSALVLGLKKEIKPTEVITWSWRGMSRGLSAGLIAALILGQILGQILGLTIGLIGGTIGGLIGELIGGLIGLFIGATIFGPVFGMSGGLIGGLSGQKMDQRSRVTPNRGIWRSARNSLVLGLIGLLIGGPSGGLIGGLILGLTSGLIGGTIGGMSGGLFGGLIGGLIGLFIGATIFGPVFGMIFGLFGGGNAFIQHFTLRWFFWLTGCMPWNYPRFLDYAADRILLRKVGGGYIFVHRLLLEYFASLDTTTKTS